MLITATGLGWQNVQQHNRSGNEQSASPIPAFSAIPATRKAETQQNSQGNTSQQHAEDNSKEAFAKLMATLQNPKADSTHQASTNKQEASDALQEFRDYMAKSPAQKIKEKMLQELGLTPEEYDALPPEQKLKIDKQIAQRIEEDAELKTQAKIAQQQYRAQAPGLVAEEVNKTTDRDIEKRYSASL
jgi:hypothetical protein